LPDTLEQVFSFLNTQIYSAEVLVVENASQDRTLEVARSYSQCFANLHVLQLEQRGKGRAVQHGMLQASGDFLFMCDADLSMPISQINQFIPPVLTDFDIAIASREAPGAVRYNEPVYRHLVGRVFNTMIHTLALPGLKDTQCGFKCFRAEVLSALPLDRIKSDGYSFQIEVTWHCWKRGYRIREIPIVFEDRRIGVSKMNKRIIWEASWLVWKLFFMRVG